MRGWKAGIMLENTAVLSARALTRRYGSTTALDGVDLDVARGGSLAIMGPSGSGKSTLLHTLAGIETPNSGSVTLALPGRAPVEITGLGEGQRSKLRREAFGFVFQSGLLIPELTAEENVAMALLINSTPRQRAIELGRQALIRMGLAGMEQRRIGELSGGQAQRVAIARAQITGDQLIFADEPTGALDSATGAEVLDALFAGTVAEGKTLVMVTHDEQVASRCDRVVRLLDGRIASDSLSGQADGVLR